MEVFERTILGNPVEAWILAGTIAGGLFAVFLLLRFLLVAIVGRLAARTVTRVDDVLVEVLRATRWWVLAALALFFAASVIVLPTKGVLAVHAIMAVVALLQVGLWGERWIAGMLGRAKREAEAGATGRATSLQVLAYLGRVALWSLVVLLALGNLGVDVTALVAGLGVGGIAVALAAQNFLGDLIASIAIALDQPFVVGDFIAVGDLSGTVERVGLKTTRMRSISGEQLVFPNNDLLGSRVRNYKRMSERRILFGFGVTFATPVARLEEIPGLVREIVTGTERARFDRAHLLRIGASSLEYEVVYYVLSPDYGVYMDVQQAINLALCRAFETRGIEFAFPTRTLYLEPGAQPLALAPPPETRPDRA